MCGTWRNNLLYPYGTYEIANLNDYTPTGVVIPSIREIPWSRWEFYYDGTARGYAYNDAFLATIIVANDAGALRQQVVYGGYRQNKRKLRLTFEPTPAQARIPSSAAGVNVATNVLTTLTPHGFVGKSGPFRFEPGTPANTLPAPLTTTQNYFIVWVSPTSFRVSPLADGVPVIDITTRGNGTHTIYPFGEPLGNSYEHLSQSYLLEGSNTVSGVDPVSVTRIKTKARIDRNASEFRIRLIGRTTYGIVTPDVDSTGVRGRLRYKAESSNCPVPVVP